MRALQLRHIAFIGFGEAGSILGGDLVKAGCQVSMHDMLLDGSDTRAAMLAKAQALAVAAHDTLAQAVAGADLIISAVTASAASEVASAAAAALRPGQIFLDINSVAPSTKRAESQTVEAAGADYVEGAVMAPVPPQRLRVPILLGGPRAAELALGLRALGMDASPISAQIGVASAVKMCRSILIKGLEALTVESLLAARRLGAEEEVLASLAGTFPSMGWQESLPDYLVSRVAEHGRRRAAEMREVAVTLEEVGIEPTLALAVAARHDALADAMAAAGIGYSQTSSFSWRALSDALNEGIRP